MHLRQMITTAWIFVFSATASALVDMKNANFSDYWVDMIVPGSGFDLKVSRTYSSRSLFSGSFGYGWCSNFETSLTTTMEGNLVLDECGGGLSIPFYPAAYNTKLINDSVNKILAAVKKKYPGKTPKYMDDLAEQLRSNHIMRTQVAGEFGIKITPVQNTVYLANGKEVDKIVYDGNYYVRNLNGGGTQKFDNKGKLVLLYDKAKNYVRINYAGDLPSQIADNLGRKISFSYYPDKKIKQIVSSSGMMVNYRFHNENLIGVTNAWKNTYSYNYDNNHNLTKINFPDGTFKSIAYNEAKDWVREFRDRDGCVETYDFTLSNENPKDHYWSTSQKRCKGKVTSKSRYEFWYQTRPDKEKYLSRVLSERNSEVVDISYHQDFGKPIAVRKNADLTTLQYYANGLVKTKTVSFTQPQADESQKYAVGFTYDNDSKITETVTDLFSKAGKLIKKRKTQFKYDTVGRLVSAKNNDGQSIDIGYNKLGLIASITDQAKKEILIEYDKNSRKPTAIVRPSVGSIQLTYGAAGEIKKVKNKGGPSVNSQVYSAFNNFVDMVGPVSSELNLNL